MVMFTLYITMFSDNDYIENNTVLNIGGKVAHISRQHTGIARKLGMDTREILVEQGRRRMVGGQKDMIVDVALDLKKKQG